MRRLLRYFLLTLLILTSLQARAASDNDLRILTTEYQPYSYAELGRTKGYSVEIIKAILTQLELDAPIEVLPWARTYQTALNRPNTLIFSIARTPEREAHFHWIGKLFPMKTYLYIAADRKDITINSLEDASHYVVSGVIEGAPSQWLESQGIKMFNSSGVYDSRIRMLINHRIDLLLSDPMSLETEMRQAHIDVSLVKPVLYLPEPSYDLYFALSKGSDVTLVSIFEQAYQQLVDSGQYQKLTQPFRDRYQHLSISND